MTYLTKQQRKALYALWQRSGVPTYRQFRGSVVGELGGFGAVLVPFCGMWVGIEKDGYAHS